MTAVRVILLAAAMSLGMALPAAAQQAASGSTAAPTIAAPAAEAPKADAAPVAGAAPVVTMQVPDMNAMVQRLRRDMERLTESARLGAHDFLTRKNPYVITTDQLAVIAGGAVAGAIVIDLIGGGGLATLAGAAVGGVAGHWLYTHPENLRMPEMPKMPELKLPPMPKLPTLGGSQQG